LALDLTSLEKAVGALQRAISVDLAQKEMSEEVREVLRSGVVQSFEVAYEQCWKFMQRWLRDNQSLADADNVRTRKDLFRAAARYGLIADPTVWFSYGEARNLTSHTYNERQASAVYESARKFAADAQAFLDKLQALNG
jgi:nucleotidyltransferase substrate binding protein (TIGR01987 family)